jgi:hypothetical protein
VAKKKSAPRAAKRPSSPITPAPSSAPVLPASGYIEGPGALKASLDGLGFERIQHHAGSTYRDSSTVIIVPSREDKFHVRVVQAWQNLIAPMNQKRAFIYVTGDEVGVAYTNMVKTILEHPELSKWRYVMTLESDNLPPPDAHIRLLESIEQFGLDGVSGIYFTKGDVNMPMCYGDPAAFQQTGVLDFKPRDIRAALNAGDRVVECSGIAMGCSLYRMDLFRQIEAPWFVTTSDIVEGKGPVGYTQDLAFCEKAKRAGKRFAVDLRVRVGHLDLATGVVY